MVAWMNDEHPFPLFFKVKNTAAYCNFILTAIATDLLLWMTMEKRRKCLIVQIVAEEHMCSAVGSTFVLKNKGTEDICLDPPKNKLSWVNTTYICNSRIKQAYFFLKNSPTFLRVTNGFHKNTLYATTVLPRSHFWNCQIKHVVDFLCFQFTWWRHMDDNLTTTLGHPSEFVYTIWGAEFYFQSNPFKKGLCLI